MSTTRLQFVRWTVPAFALILGLLWYKRRRADRADPGGKNDSKKDLQSRKSNVRTNFNDGDLRIDDSFKSSISIPIKTDISCSTRQVSESLAIPPRKPSSLSVTSDNCNKSLAGSDDQAWYKDVEMTIDLEQNAPPPLPRIDDSLQKRRSSRRPRSKSPLQSAEIMIREHITKMLDKSDNDKSSTMVNEVKIDEQASSERDSANHSPVSGVLDGSVSDEVRSEGSSDSGKGGSINGNSPTVYEFVLPQYLIGRLIGRHGVFLNSIKTKGQVNILIKRHPETNKLKVCAIEGSTQGINTALEMIRQKLPQNKYPCVTLEQVSFLKKPEQQSWIPEVMQLKLVEGMNNDVTVIRIIEPNHLVLHLPTHPSYPSLRILDHNMTQLYDTTTDAPGVPEQLKKGMIFVAKWYDRWVRVYVQKPDPEGEKNLVRLIDHGGSWILRNSDMRKIRYDYLTLPFQAIEVYLANIQPKNGTWVQEAYDLVYQITQGIVAQAQIQGYVNEDTHINLYLNIQKHGVISLADELIARGYADPVHLEEVV